MRVDLHVHSCYSRDSDTSLDDILTVAERRGMDMIALTDHGTIAGALVLHKRAPARVIIGQEVLTSRGELLAYFVREEIPSGLEPAEAIGRLREQGAVIGVPHPADVIRGETLQRHALAELLPAVDCLETFNARVLWAGFNRRAAKLARIHRLPATAGSDAHFAHAIGRAYVEMPAFSDAASFLASLRAGQVHGTVSGWEVHLQSLSAKVRRRIRRAAPECEP